MEKVMFEGKAYYYSEEPYPDNYRDEIAFYVDGKDSEGNDVQIVWAYQPPEWFDADSDNPNDLSDFADWDNPIEVNLK